MHVAKLLLDKCLQFNIKVINHTEQSCEKESVCCEQRNKQCQILEQSGGGSPIVYQYWQPLLHPMSVHHLWSVAKTRLHLTYNLTIKGQGKKRRDGIGAEEIWWRGNNYNFSHEVNSVMKTPKLIFYPLSKNTTRYTVASSIHKVWRIHSINCGDRENWIEHFP